MLASTAWLALATALDAGSAPPLPVASAGDVETLRGDHQPPAAAAPGLGPVTLSAKPPVLDNAAVAELAERLFEVSDTNNDDRLDHEERQRAATLLTVDFKLADRNRDGDVDHAEFRRWSAAGPSPGTPRH